MQSKRPLDFCWLHWLMADTKDSQYLLRQTFAKIHPSTAMHRLTRCFLLSCLSSWQDKVLFCSASPTEMTQKAVWKKSVSRVRGEGWDHKVCPETEIVNYFLKKEKTSDLCVGDFVLHLVWNYPVSTLELYRDWQLSLILSAGWGLSMLWDTHHEGALMQFSLPAPLSNTAHMM